LFYSNRLSISIDKFFFFYTIYSVNTMHWHHILLKGGGAMGKIEYTSEAVASKASKLLSNPKTAPKVKSAAASALTQAPNKSKKKQAVMNCNGEN
jgi:hypothetical protein